MPDPIIISLDTERDTQTKLRKEIEFFSERLSRLERRANMVYEEIRQTKELLTILKDELKGGSHD